MSPGRRIADALLPPNADPASAGVERGDWLGKAAQGFVAPSKANRIYYLVILKLLWPEGHGIPGPAVTEGQIRDAINEYRKDRTAAGKAYKPYLDPFRRLRELQGEEGFYGIARSGRWCQLTSLEVEPKRIPRVGLSADDWALVLLEYGHQCANCGRKEPDVRLDQDHKIPRVRADISSGGDRVDNWQPLCTECNNFKSTACRGCDLDCRKCPWAFPRIYAPIILNHDIIEAIRKGAAERGRSPHDFANELLRDALR